MTNRMQESKESEACSRCKEQVAIAEGILREPDETGGGVKEVDTPAWEKPSVEGAWQSHNIVRHKHIPLLLLNLPLVFLQGAEDVIKILSGEVIREELDLRWLLRPRASPHATDDVEHLGDHQQKC